MNAVRETVAVAYQGHDMKIDAAKANLAVPAILITTTTTVTSTSTTTITTTTK